MKPKLISALLALNLVSWAQSNAPIPAPEQQKSAPADAKAACPCCADKTDTADHAKGMVCMRDAKAGKGEKEAMCCCSEKDGKHSCCGKDMKTCSKDMKAAGGEKCADDCCSAKDAKHSAHDCCNEKQCGKHDDHEHTAPGN